MQMVLQSGDQQLGELGDAEVSVTLKTVVCLEAQVLLFFCLCEANGLQRGQSPPACVSSFCSADLLSTLISFLHGSSTDVSSRRRWEVVE